MKQQVKPKLSDFVFALYAQMTERKSSLGRELFLSCSNSLRRLNGVAV